MQLILVNQSNYGSFEIPTLPAGYSWKRDINGNVIGTLTISAIDNDDIYHEASQPIYIQNVPNTFISSGTLTSNTVWCGTITLTGSITVPEGITLMVNPGTVVKFPPSSSLIVNGQLNANGCTFTSTGSETPGSWGTITLSGSGSCYSIIQNTTIVYGTEIDIINTDGVMIQNCAILNSSMYGINFSGTGYFEEGNSAYGNTIENSNIYHALIVQNGAMVILKGNTIKKSNLNHRGSGIYISGQATIEQNDISGFDWGIGDVWGSYVDAGWVGYEGWNNRITNCNTGINIYRESYCYFGDMSNPGERNNSIHDNISYNAAIGSSYPTYPSWLWAEYNWWDDTTKYYKSEAGTAYFWFPLRNDPWSAIPLPSIKQNTGKQVANNNISSNTLSMQNKSVNASILSQNLDGNSNNSVIDLTSYDQFDSLNIGLNLKKNKKNSEAKDFFISFLKKHPDNQAAYVLLYHSADKNTTSEIINYFNSLSKQA